MQRVIDDLRGVQRRKKNPIQTTFLTTVEPEPFRPGVCDLPEGFYWTDKEPTARPDFFQPANIIGDLFTGDELASEIFLTLHKPAIDLLLRSVNETGKEFVEKGKWKRFRAVDYKEMLRFHSCLLFSQVVKISRFDTYWSKKSIAKQPFVAAQMSFKRFKQIKRCIRCYVPSEVKENGMSDPKSPNYDPLYKITPMETCLLKNYRQYRFPKREITIDEQMVKFKVRYLLCVGASEFGSCKNSF